jgi:hypothetical protein
MVTNILKTNLDFVIDLTEMNPAAFSNLISTLESSSFDDDKVNTIKTFIHAARVVSPTQIAQCMRLITFGNSKVEVAKMAYRYIPDNDKGSYASIVGKEFSFSKEKNELNEYICQQ